MWHRFFCFANQHMLWVPVAYNNIRLSAKYGTQIPQIAFKSCRYVCAPKQNIGLISHAWILERHFFLFSLRPFLLHTTFTNAYYPPDAKFCMQIIQIALKPAKTKVAHKSKLLKLHYFVWVWKIWPGFIIVNNRNDMTYSFDSRAYLCALEIR